MNIYPEPIGFDLNQSKINNPSENFINYLGDGACETDCFDDPESKTIPFEEVRDSSPEPMYERINIINDINYIDNILSYNIDHIGVFKIIRATKKTITLCRDRSNDNDPSFLDDDIIDYSPEISIGSSYSDEIDVVTDIVVESKNLRVVKHRIKIVSIINPINEISIIAAPISCDNTKLSQTNSEDVQLSTNYGSSYDNSLISNITVVTDIFIDSNGNIMKKRSNIRVPIKYNSDYISDTAIASSDCNSNESEPPEEEKETKVLFDISLNDNEYFTQYPKLKENLIDAMEKWNQFLYINPEYTKLIRKEFKDWNGIKLTQFSVLYKNNSTLARCGMTSAKDFENKKVPLEFGLEVNTKYADMYFIDYDLEDEEQNNFYWFRVLIHELGHALGLVNLIDQKNTKLSGEEYPETFKVYKETLNKAYELIKREKLLPKEQIEYYNIPWSDKEGGDKIYDVIILETVGGQGSKGVHWKKTLVEHPINNRRYKRKKYLGFCNEALLTSVQFNLTRISLMSIKMAIDLGYFEHNPGLKEDSLEISLGNDCIKVD